MAIPTVFRQQAFSAADFHGQLKIQTIPLSLQRDYDSIHVQAVVVVVFRSVAPIDVGSVIEFDLPVVKRDATELPDGGLFCRFEDVLETRHIEVCLNRRAQQFQLAADLVEVIGGPTGVPAITFPPIDLLPPHPQKAESRLKWWQRWKSG